MAPARIKLYCVSVSVALVDPQPGIDRRIRGHRGAGGDKLDKPGDIPIACRQGDARYVCSGCRGERNRAARSIVIKMMRQKFDQQWSVRKTHANAGEQVRILRMLREGSLTLEARLEGPTLTVEDLLGLSEGHLLTFDYPVERPVELLVNGTHKFVGQMVSTGRKRACVVEKVLPVPSQGKISEEGAGGSGTGPAT